MRPTRVLLAASFALVVASCASRPPEPQPQQPGEGNSVKFMRWPMLGPVTGATVLGGHTNVVPDVVGPVDGSAKITVLSEGNHFPALLPLVFDEFPAWCQAQSECDVEADEILVITLPQYMVLDAMERGGIRFGNLVLPFVSDRVYPDLVMGGRGPLGRLAAEGEVEKTAFVLAEHRGMGLLVRSDSSVESLADLVDTPQRMVFATPTEAGAREQYLETLGVLLGDEATEEIIAREVAHFGGRLRIQHRDVPYALVQNHADVGLLFEHLALFWAESYPNDLRWIPVPESDRFGRQVLVARSTHDPSNPHAEHLRRFLLERAGDYYPPFRFKESTEFGFGETVTLTD